MIAFTSVWSVCQYSIDLIYKTLQNCTKGSLIIYPGLDVLHHIYMFYIMQAVVN